MFESRLFNLGFIFAIIGLSGLLAVGIASDSLLILLAVSGISFLLAFWLTYEVYKHNKKFMEDLRGMKRGLNRDQKCPTCDHYDHLSGGFGSCGLTRDKGVSENFGCDDWESKLN